MSIRRGYESAALPDPLPHPQILNALDGTDVVSGIEGEPDAVVMLTVERDAFVVVDTEDGGPVVTVRTLLDDGQLVETVAGAAPQTFLRAPKRSVRSAEMNEILSAHRTHVENRVLSSTAKPVAHEPVSTLMDILTWAAAHEDKVLDHLDDVMDRTPRRVRLGGLAIALVVGLGFAVADNATLAAVGVLLGGVVALLAGPVTSVLASLSGRRPAFQAGTPSVR